MLTRTLLAAALLAAGTTLAACGGSDDGDTAAGGGSGQCSYQADGRGGSVDLPPSKPSVAGQVPVTIESSVGELKLTLDADKAPCTVNSFVSLAKQGFFDGIYCPRIGDPGPQGFGILQCGDPTATDPAHLAEAGSGGPGYRFADELSGSETYPAGTLAMANSGPDTNGSQFFMVFDDIQLNPAYTVFGTIAADSNEALRKVAAAGNDGSNPAGGGVPHTPVKFTTVTVG